MLKNKLVDHCTFKTRDEARTAIFEYIEVLYNRQRRHQSLDYLSPLEYKSSMLLLDLLCVKSRLAHCAPIIAMIPLLRLLWFRLNVEKQP